MAGWFGFGPSTVVDVTFEAPFAAPLKTVTVKAENGTPEPLTLFSGNDTLAGAVHVTPPPGKKVEHTGVKVELIGQIELYNDRSNTHDFIALVRELDAPGEITEAQRWPFEFNRVEMQYESYRGAHVKLRYFLRVTVARAFGTPLVKEFLFWVRNPQPAPEVNNSIKMEVGIEDCLHIEFEYAHSKYHLKDVIVGKIFFLLVRIKLKHMELELRRRESVGVGTSASNESERLAQFEVMDGAPVRGESIPVRFFLAPYDLTPTYKSINNKFSVRYYLNLVLVDEEDRRYFKQQEITLFRESLT